MKIVSLIKNDNQGFYGFVEQKSEYTEFLTERDGKIVFKHSYLKSEYSDYLHFANVMSKFAPEIPFLIAPIEISELCQTELARAMTLIDSL